jgi:serine/threonine-protein kinase
VKAARPPAHLLPDFAPTEARLDVDPTHVEPKRTEWVAHLDETAPVPLEMMPPPNEADPTIGHVGRYALKARLGEGGIGRVYTAWDPVLSRNVAIKVLHTGAAGAKREDLDAMILAEARIVAGLNHAHIVTVHDAGLSELGVYVAMEQLPGCDLRRLLDDGWRPDPVRAAKLARRVADALAYAHDRGVIHCDIKPSNIFMVDKRQPKVLDFGIARVANRSGRAALEGLITGSPHYLAPEQLEGGKTDARSDVYALGVVLYELLTGRKAFPGHTLEAISESVLEGRWIPARVALPGVPAELSAIAERAMALEPRQRFQSAREMSTALRQWQLKMSAQLHAHAAARANARLAQAKPDPEAHEEPAYGGRLRFALATGVAIALAAAAVWWQMH